MLDDANWLATVVARYCTQECHVLLDLLQCSLQSNTIDRSRNRIAGQEEAAMPSFCASETIFSSLYSTSTNSSAK